MTDDLLPFRRMLKRIKGLGDPESGYTPGNMALTWGAVRAQFIQEWLPRNAQGVTQKEIAGAGGHQSTISKIVHDPNYTPRIDTFLKVLDGLDIKATDFFSRAEGLSRARGGDKRASGSHAKGAVVPAVELKAFALDLIDALQDLVAKYDKLPKRRTPDKTDHETPAPEQTATGKAPRS